MEFICLYKLTIHEVVDNKKYLFENRLKIRWPHSITGENR